MIFGKLDLLSALYICKHLRKGDREEAVAQRFGDDMEALAAEIYTSWGPGLWLARADDGLPVAMIGYSERWPGVWQCWMLATDRFGEVGKGLTRWVKQSMLPSLVERGAHRIEAHSIDGHDLAHRWLRFCGATEEARLRRYGRNGEDFLVFSILPDSPPCA